MNEKKHSLIFNCYNKNFEIRYGSKSLSDLDAEFYEKQAIVSVYTGQKLEVFCKNKLVISEIINHSKIFTYSGDIVPLIPEDMVPLFHDVNRVKLVKNLSF